MIPLLVAILIFFSQTSTLHAADYYVSPTGLDTNPGTLAAPFAKIQTGINTLQPGDTLYLRGGTYPERVIINRLGNSTGWTTITKYQEEIPIIDGQGIIINPSAGLVDIRNSNYLIIQGLTVINSDDAAIYARASQNLDIQNNHTRESNSSGIGVWSSAYITVKHNLIVNARNAPTIAYGGHEECISIASTRNFEVSYNEVYYEGMTGYLGGAGIDIKESSYQGSVHHNYVHDIIYDGAIYLDAWTAGLNGTPTLHQVDVYANRAERTGGISLGSERGGIIEDIRVFNNLIIDSSFSGIVMHNTGEAIGGNGLRKNIHIFNNTIFRSTGNGGAGIYLITANVENIVIQNNLVAFDPKWVGQITLAHPEIQNQVTVDHNLTYGRRLCSNDFPDCYNYIGITQDPQFVDIPSLNLQLQSTSPALNAGIDVGIYTDYHGTTRPQGSSFDIGAFEYVAPPPSPTPVSFDFDTDGDTDILDLLHLLTHFGNSYTIFNFNTLLKSI
jgi:hypothetical protein